MHQNQDYNKMNYLNEEIEKFFKKIIYPGNDTDCWLWNGYISKGYAIFSFRKKQIQASRFIYQCYNGPLLSTELVRHKVCDNPECVNPHHLLKGTHSDNSQDMIEHNRSRKGSKHPLAILDEEKVENFLVDCLNGKFRCMSEVEKAYNCHRRVIQGVLYRKSWKHITDKFSDAQLLKILNILSETRNLKEDTIQEIRDRLNSGESGYSIAKNLNIKSVTVSQIKNKKAYINLQG